MRSVLLVLALVVGTLAIRTDYLKFNLLGHEYSYTYYTSGTYDLTIQISGSKVFDCYLIPSSSWANFTSDNPFTWHVGGNFTAVSDINTVLKSQTFLTGWYAVLHNPAFFYLTQLNGYIEATPVVFPPKEGAVIPWSAIFHILLIPVIAIPVLVFIIWKCCWKKRSAPTFVTVDSGGNYDRLVAPVE